MKPTHWAVQPTNPAKKTLIFEVFETKGGRLCAKHKDVALYAHTEHDLDQKVRGYSHRLFKGGNHAMPMRK